mmetsp:Transcript_21073/g.61497  ORF Transcript_21073/g.61497 Transcript_21073/m.61497 type:complete len:188 (-) Transcript_21073:212-775(-)
MSAQGRVACLLLHSSLSVVNRAPCPARDRRAENMDGNVPENYGDLIKLSGVGPKIAHLLRSVAFGQEDAGIVVDTHVHRISRQLGWAQNCATPEKTRVQLEQWVPPLLRVEFTLATVGLGQICQRHGATWGTDLVAAVERKYGVESDRFFAALEIVRKINSAREREGGGNSRQAPSLKLKAKRQGPK